MVRGQATGALHSRTIEKRMAAAKKANTRCLVLIFSIIPSAAIESPSEAKARSMI